MAIKVREESWSTASGVGPRQGSRSKSKQHDERPSQHGGPRDAVAAVDLHNTSTSPLARPWLFGEDVLRAGFPSPRALPMLLERPWFARQVTTWSDPRSHLVAG